MLKQLKKELHQINRAFTVKRGGDRWGDISVTDLADSLPR